MRKILSLNVHTAGTGATEGAEGTSADAGAPPGRPLMNLLGRLPVRRILRYTGLSLMLAVAILAASLVASLTVDLGPSVRSYAESAGSRYIERPLHIGKLSIHLLTGRVVVEDLAIEGVRPGDRPFFTAKHIAVALDWTTAFRRIPEITIASVEMTDWQMLAEKWERGRHNFPKFGRDNQEPDGPKRFETTLKYLRASRGQFTFEDHGAPWSIVCPNLNITIGNVPNYHGEAVFTGGIVQIQDHLPMWTDMKARFVVDGSQIRLDRIDFTSDGSTTVARGAVDTAKWPEQSYDFESRMHFQRMRELFFRDETWQLAGDGDFTGKFHIIKGPDDTPDSYDLSGTFKSELAGVNGYQFPALYGSLRWTPAAFEVWDAGAKFYGGNARFNYSIKPLGLDIRPMSRFDASLTNVNLATYTDLERLPGQRFAGAASGHVLIEWPLGLLSERRGNASLSVAPPSGVRPMTASLDVFEAADAGHARHEWGPFAPLPLPRHLPIAGELTCVFGPDEVVFGPSRFVTERTHVAFEGATMWGERSTINFHVTSADWQESDQVLVGLLHDFGASASTVAIGGRGEFDGVMTGSFRGPRIEGVFSGDDVRARDTLWGATTGRIVYENSYVTITDGVVRQDDSVIFVDGLFSIGYPRADGGEQLDARFKLMRRDLDGLRHAFLFDDYPVSGRMSGEFHLAGGYERPIGFGAMTIDEMVAFGEPFAKATASLRFEEAGVRLDGAEIAKGAGTITGAAFLDWDGSYAVTADGRQISIDQVARLSYPRVPLSGMVEFSASGAGTFDDPRYDITFRASDLFVAKQSVGLVTGTLAVRGQELSSQIDAASPSLDVKSTGRVALTARGEGEITFRFEDTTIDPYVRLFAPNLSPLMTTVVSGSIRVVGGLADLDRMFAEGTVDDSLSVDVTIDQVDMRLLDYTVKNARPIHLVLESQQLRADDLELIGDETRLIVWGMIGLNDRRVTIEVYGEANLGVMEGLLPDVRASGYAEMNATIRGPLDEPIFLGTASISDGRIRHVMWPHSFEAINGTLYVDARGIHLDDVTATVADGRVQLGGRIGLAGFVPSMLDVTAHAEDMRLRIPEGVRSTVDADLTLGGTIKSPELGGLVTVKNAVWTRRLDAPGSILDLTRLRPSSEAPAGAVDATPALPVKLDVRILAPSTFQVDTNLVRLWADAELTLSGTYDQPLLTGHADVERGDVNFEGRRYRIVRGAIDLADSTRGGPFFDVEAETSVRVPAQSGQLSQTYRITVGVVGTRAQFRPTVTSDPPLPAADAVALLLGGERRTQDRNQDIELRALQNPNQSETDILTARLNQALAAPLSAEVGRIVEQTFGVDTFQLSPTFIDLFSQTSRLNSPTARLTIGKRVSDRVYVTFSRSLGTTVNDQIVFLEYEQSERLSWVLSRNEDQQTYALEFRVRRTF